ncbi:hypothetical protein SCOCK_30042 [Actinacidiphila cocklensis]|uniref:Uncharacterized protein n=1 Tax=Actinacidiphila cocklensis TaxID=887465 RepID=A0A9W4DSK5_9ACTN|nr:hypothetical protein SCOCK_30042 [Actinacidiphila cocklensis]
MHICRHLRVGCPRHTAGPYPYRSGPQGPCGTARSPAPATPAGHRGGIPTTYERTDSPWRNAYWSPSPMISTAARPRKRSHSASTGSGTRSTSRPRTRTNCATSWRPTSRPAAAARFPAAPTSAPPSPPPRRRSGPGRSRTDSRCRPAAAFRRRSTKRSTRRAERRAVGVCGRPGHGRPHTCHERDTADPGRLDSHPHPSASVWSTPRAGPKGQVNGHHAGVAQ